MQNNVSFLEVPLMHTAFTIDSSEFFVGKEFWRFATLDGSISMETVGRPHVD